MKGLKFLIVSALILIVSDVFGQGVLYRASAPTARPRKGEARICIDTVANLRWVYKGTWNSGRWFTQGQIRQATAPTILPNSLLSNAEATWFDTDDNSTWVVNSSNTAWASAGGSGISGGVVNRLPVYNSTSSVVASTTISEIGGRMKINTSPNENSSGLIVVSDTLKSGGNNTEPMLHFKPTFVNIGYPNASPSKNIYTFDPRQMAGNADHLGLWGKQATYSGINKLSVGQDTGDLVVVEGYNYPSFPYYNPNEITVGENHEIRYYQGGAGTAPTDCPVYEKITVFQSSPVWGAKRDWRTEGYYNTWDGKSIVKSFNVSRFLIGGYNNTIRFAYDIPEVSNQYATVTMQDSATFVFQKPNTTLITGATTNGSGEFIGARDSGMALFSSLVVRDAGTIVSRDPVNSFINLGSSTRPVSEAIGIHSRQPSGDLFRFHTYGAGNNSSGSYFLNFRNGVFGIRRNTDGQYPFMFSPDAPANALRLETNGNVGVGGATNYKFNVVGTSNAVGMAIVGTHNPNDYGILISPNAITGDYSSIYAAPNVSGRNRVFLENLNSGNNSRMLLEMLSRGASTNLSGIAGLSLRSWAGDGYLLNQRNLNAIVFKTGGSDETNATVRMTVPLDGNTPITFNDATAIRVPVGTDAQRPATPQNGMIRFNTTTNTYEGYCGTCTTVGWKPITINN